MSNLCTFHAPFFATRPPGTAALTRLIRIALAPPDTTAQVADLLKIAFEDAAWSAERVQHEFIEAPNVLTTWVIEREGQAVATASSQVSPLPHANAAYVHCVAGHPAHPGLGLGLTVTLAVLHEFAQLRLAEVFLWTDDFRSAAIKTYLKLGFSPEHCDHSHPERWDAVIAKITGQNAGFHPDA